MRVIARRERPHPGAQLRLTDHNGWRITCFATNTPGPPGWTTADLEVRHRQRARAEDRIRGLKDTGLRNLPFHGYAHNQIWLEIVALAADLLAWTQTLAFDDHDPARRWEPKRLRLRLLAVAGRIIRTGTPTTSPAPDQPTETINTPIDRPDERSRLGPPQPPAPQTPKPGAPSLSPPPPPTAEACG